MGLIDRRKLITGLISFAVTAPAIVRADSLMKVKVVDPYDGISIRKLTEYVPFAVNVDPKAFWLYSRDDNGTLVPFTKEQTEAYWKSFNDHS